MIYYILRMIFVLIFTYVTWQIGKENSQEALGIILGLLGSIIFVIFEMFFSKRHLSVFFSVISGLFLGLLVSLFFAQLINFIPSEYNITVETKKMLGFLITVFMCFISIVLILRARGNYKLIIPFMEFKPQGPQRKRIVLDTSTVIDGRIAEMTETHIFDQILYVPDFVLQEIHQLADSSDKNRRNKGRRGLEILNKLRSNPRLQIDIINTTFDNQQNHDAKLIQFSLDLNGRIVTTDYNLHKLAQLRGIDVLNLNDLAVAMRSMLLPGDLLNLKLLKAGDEYDQAIGFLEDGTMVVVKDARKFIGAQIQTEVTSVLQKPTGRIIFAKVASAGYSHNSEPSKLDGDKNIVDDEKNSEKKPKDRKQSKAKKRSGRQNKPTSGGNS